MLKLGILPRTLLLLILIFAGAAVAVHQIYIPALDRKVTGQLLEVAEQSLATSRRLMHTRADHLADKNRRELLDIPFELTAGDPDRTRAQVDEYARGFGETYRGNVDLMAREMKARIGRDATEKATGLAEEFKQSALTGLLLLLGAVVVLNGAALARTLLLPLARLLKATERVGDGDLTERVGIKGGDEVGRLGTAFDGMTDSLRTSREEIEALNRSLADKVREKTLALEERNRELADANERLLGTISELKKTRNALVHSETMASIGTLAGGVAHEFNNLLGGIIGCAQDTRDEEDPAEVRAGLGMILRTAERACNITENLLRFSRPPEHKPRKTDLSEVVQEAIDLVGPEVRSRQIAVTADLNPATALVDPGQIHQVVLNLLTNAIRSMDADGRLAVRVLLEHDEVSIEVSDSGTGIPEEDRNRIFEPFFTTRKGGGEQSGTGLGLSVSYSIVKAHGGRIEVESAAGEGSVFRVVLPVGEED